MTILGKPFFDRDASLVAKQLLGKVIRRKYQQYWLSARIIETEAYYIEDKGSHASLGFTEKRKALFMPAGTIYMYYARGKDSLNISCKGEGNAVLIKAAYPCADRSDDPGSLDAMIKMMKRLNPTVSGQARPIEKLCSGQTLLCRSLDINVKEWDSKQFDREIFYIEDTGVSPDSIIQTTRLGIPLGRDEHLMYRYVDYDYAPYCTSNPLSKRRCVAGKDYLLLKP